MVRLAGRFGLLGVMLALGAALPAAVLAADPDAIIDAPAVGAVGPTVIDVLANDLAGDASPTRPLTITSVTSPGHGSVRTDGRSVIYDPSGCYTGLDRFDYTISDGSGATDTTTAIFTVARPPSAPATDVPQAGFVRGSTMGSTVPLQVSWCGAVASGATFQSYRLTQSTDGGSTFGSALVTGSATSTTRSAAVGTRYAWRVRTTDSKGLSETTSLVSRVGRFQESSGAIDWSAGWKTARSGKYSGNRERYTTRKGATATLATSGVRQFAIVASTGPGRGSFHVYVDGTRVTGSPVSQRAKKAGWRRVLFVGSIPGDTAATHTIRVKTTSRARVDIDAIVTLSGRAGQAVAFGGDPGGRTYRDDPWTPTASAGSGLPVLVTLSQASWPVCALDDGVVTFHGVGTCSVVATQVGDATWNGATTTEAIAVAPAPLTVTGITAEDRTYAPGDTSAAIDATGAALQAPLPGDEGAVTLVTTGATGSFADASAGVDRTVTIAGLTLSGPKAALYAITLPTTTATIDRASQSISFSTTAPADAVMGGPAYAVVATATSGLPVALAVAPASAGVCELDGGDVTFPGSGTCTIVASQAGDGNWLGATDATQEFAVAETGSTPQTITFHALPAATYGDAPLALDPTVSSELAVALASQTTLVCTLSGTTLTLVAAGTCTVEATQAGNATFAPATPVTQSFDVGPKALGVTGIAADDRPYDGTTDATLDLGAAGLTGVVAGDDVSLDVGGATGTFASANAGPGITVAVSGLGLDGEDAANYVLGAASTTATISQAGLTVTADDQAIDYGDPDPAFTFSYGPFADGDGPGDIDTPPTCGVVGLARDVAGSPYAITCSGGSDGNYAFTYADGELVVSQAAQAITFDTVPPEPATVGGGYDPTATATSGLGVTITLAGSSTGICSLSGGTITFEAEGTCTVLANQAGDGNHLAAPEVEQAFAITAP